MDSSAQDELIARYFPYLAFELREAGHEEQATQLLENGSREIHLEDADLRSIVRAGVQSGSGIAHTVAFEMRVRALLVEHPHLPLDDEIHFGLNELDEVFRTLRQGKVLSSYSKDEMRERFEELFSYMQDELGTLIVLEVLGAFDDVDCPNRSS